MTFDATSREFCQVRRVRTNTPLQALTLLNDPASFEAARALAGRMMQRRRQASATTARARRLRRQAGALARGQARRADAALVALYDGERRHYQERAARGQPGARVDANGAPETTRTWPHGRSSPTSS